MADEDSKIPYGFCQCGCGQKTNLASTTNNKRGTIKGKPMRFISGHNTKIDKPWLHNQTGENHYNWQGGIRYDRNYKQIYMPTHPKAQKNYVYEHIIIAEHAIGHYLPDKVVIHHHTPDKIVICQDQAYHVLLHKRTRAWNACGNASWLKCKYCKEYDDPQNISISGSSYRHRDCYNKYQIKTRKIRKLKLLNNFNINPPL